LILATRHLQKPNPSSDPPEQITANVQERIMGTNTPHGWGMRGRIYKDAEHRLSASGSTTPGSTMLTRLSPLCGPCSRVRQCVTPFMVRLAGVSTNVYPRHFVVGNQLIELLPKILVYDGPTGGVTPSVVLPSREELGDPAADIVGVGQHRDLAGTLQRPQSLDCRGKLHSIVGRVRHSSLQHALMFAVPKDARPASRTGIPQA